MTEENFNSHFLKFKSKQFGFLTYFITQKEIWIVGDLLILN